MFDKVKLNQQQKIMLIQKMEFRIILWDDTGKWY